MKKIALKMLILTIITGLVLDLFGCASLSKKFTRKKTKEKLPVYYQVREYDIKPSLDLYEKHYIFWSNWHRKFIVELGRSYKSDIRSSQEMRGNLDSMAALLTDEKVAELAPHIEEIRKAETIILKRNMTKANETRIRQIAEREYRVIRGRFAPSKMAGSIRSDWKE